MNRICLVSWFHLAVSLVNICRMTLLLMERCWSLSEYVVTIFTAFSFAFDSWFFFSSACSVLYPKLEVAIPLSTHHPSPIASPSTSTATKCLQYPSSSRMHSWNKPSSVMRLSAHHSLLSHSLFKHNVSMRLYAPLRTALQNCAMSKSPSSLPSRLSVFSFLNLRGC